MEEDCSPCELPTKLSSLIKPPFHLHSSAISSRSLSPSCTRAASRLESTPSTASPVCTGADRLESTASTGRNHHRFPSGALRSRVLPAVNNASRGSGSGSGSGTSSALRNLISISAGCMGSSSTTLAVADVQVPARGGNISHHTTHSQVRKSKQYASKSASQKQIVPKKGFTAPFNKAYARVSDVSGTKWDASPVLVPVKSGSKIRHKSVAQNTEEATDLCGSENSCTRKFMQACQPLVKYTYEPSKVFYESMLEMVVVGCLDGCNDFDLEGMFACYLVLNLPKHRLHIEEAFRRLLTKLYSTHGLHRIGTELLASRK